MSQHLPGKGFFGWLGRQIGYVTKALKSEPQKPALYRDRRVEEATLSDDPNIRLRRTTIDEVIIEKEKSS